MTYKISTAGEQYLPTIKAAAAQYNVPWELLAAQLEQESGFDPNAVSSTGAQGIAQFMPGTAAQYGLSDPFDPTSSIYAEAHLMSDLHNEFGSWLAALAAYNAGSGNVSAAISAANANNDGANWLNYLPTSPSNQAQTQNYVAVISQNSGLALT